MAKTFSLRYLETAINDLEEIIIYAMENGKTYVNKLIDDLDTQISILKIFPTMGKIYNNTKLSSEYRVIIIDQYLIFYTINANVIETHRIIYSKRNYLSIL